MEFPPALARRVLRQMLQIVRGSLHGVTHAHIESLLRFAAEAQSGKIQTLPGGTVARKEFSWLVVGPAASEPGGGDFSYSFAPPAELVVSELGCTFRPKILNRGDPGRGYNNSKFLGLDLQKLCGELILRNWRAGDSFSPTGSRGVRKLKELFRERKIPEARRKGWPVLLCAGQIVWVRGFPPAKGVAATDQTQEVLILEEEPTRPSPVAREKPI
jgi:tRNA(Ile)-lysidine synthase